MGKTGYDFYLNKCLLPIAPDKLQIKINNANSKVTLIDEGQINILKKAELTDIEFDCIIPQVKYPFASYKGGFKGASYFLDYFEELKASRKPFQFIVSRVMPSGKVLFSTNIKVSLEEYKITEQASEGFDLGVKFKLKQYKEYGTKTVSIKSSEGSSDEVPKATVEEPRSTENAPKGEYKVGDVVNYHGGTHFYTSYEGAKGYPARAGKARITIANGKGKAHPWHLIHTDSSSNVYGWVDEGSFD